MSDYNSSLPIRTENAGDAIVKIADATVPSQQLKVESDGSINIRDNGSSITVDSVDLDIRDLEFATDKADVSGSVVALDSTTLAALESVTVQNGAGGAAVNIQDGGNSITVDAVDLDIRNLSNAQDNVAIGNGANTLAINANGSINVVPQEDAGLEDVKFNKAVAVAAASTSNHDQVFASASKLFQVSASASGKLKAEVQIETGSATDVFNTVMVGFNSTANPNINMPFAKYALIPAGARVRIIRSNIDKDPQDLYSTIIALIG